jgi:hypothetical protein
MNTSKPKPAATPRLLTDGSPNEPSHDEIARRAYALWEQQGCPQGQDMSLWLQAETQLRPSRSQHGVRA